MFPSWWTVEDEPAEIDPEFTGSAAEWMFRVRMFPGHYSRAVLILRCAEDGTVTAAMGLRAKE